MANDRYRDAATAGVGYGLTAGSAAMQEGANRRAFKVTGTKPKSFIPNGRVQFRRGHGKAMRVPRALFTAGGVTGLVGMTGAGVGTYRLVHPRKEEASKSLKEKSKDFVATGFQGTGDAFRARAENTKENPDPRNRIAPMVVGAGAGAGGSVGTHRLLDRRAKRIGTKIHPVARAGLTRPASVAAATLIGIPVANQVNRRVLHNDYVATATGVQRRKRPFHPPSRKAQVFDQKRMSRRQFRQQTVGVNKSFIGGVAKPITMMSRSERSDLRYLSIKRQQHRQRLAAYKPNPPVSAPLHTRGAPASRHPVNRLFTQLKNTKTTPSGRKNLHFGPGIAESDKQRVLDTLPKKVRRPVVVHGTGIGSVSGRLPHSTPGVTIFRTSSKSPAHVTLSHDTSPYIVRHEFTHSQARRNYGRMQGGFSHEPTLMREEARADASAVHLPHKGERKIVTGYEAEGMMHAQAQKKNKWAKRGLAAGGSYTPEGRQAYNEMRAKLGKPVRGPKELPKSLGRGRRRLIRGTPESKRNRRIGYAAGGTATAGGGGYLAHRSNQRDQQARAAARKRGQSVVFKAVEGDTADNYLGRRVRPNAQRAAIYTTGMAPLGIGPIAAAKTAAAYAPPGQERHAATRQYLGHGVYPNIGGVAGAYGAAHLAANPKVAAGIDRVQQAGAAAKTKVKSAVGLKPKETPGLLSRAKTTVGEKVLDTGAGKAVTRSFKGRLAPALVGFAGAKFATAQVTGNRAINRNLRDEKNYNLKHPVVKYSTAMDPHEQRKLARKKRLAAASSTLTGLTGLGALGAMALKRPKWQTGLLTGGAAIGGANNLNFAGVLRREAKSDSQQAQTRPVTQSHLEKSLKTPTWVHGPVRKYDQPLTRMRGDQAAKIVSQYGAKGPLPKNLDRASRMTAYEARYVHAGGKKAEHWQRRADIGDKIKTGGLGGAFAGGAGMLALRVPAVRRGLAHRVKAASHAVDTATIAAGTAGAGGELYAGHARRKRSSYSSAPAGVAASALRRMKDYTPGG